MSPNILLVDDDRIQLEIMSCILNEAAFENLIVCDSPVKALDYARATRPDLLIADYMMPVYTGTELLSMLLCRYPDLPAIIITGMDEHLCSSEGIFVIRKGMSNFFGQLVSQVTKTLSKIKIKG